MDTILFFIRHTPFWAIPIFIIALDFAYLYWLKSFKKVAFIFAFVAMLSLVSVIFYYWAGGPHKAPQAFFLFFH